jgi:hypothetical protein
MLSDTTMTATSKTAEHRETVFMQMIPLHKWICCSFLNSFPVHKGLNQESKVRFFDHKKEQSEIYRISESMDV